VDEGSGERQAHVAQVTSHGACQRGRKGTTEALAVICSHEPFDERSEHVLSEAPLRSDSGGYHGRVREQAQFLDDLKGEYALWEALLAAIGEEHMTQPGVAGEWSIKDIVAHMTGWRRRALGRFQAALRHEPTPLPPWPPHLQTDDEINAWIYASTRDRPVSEVLRESRAVLQQLMEMLTAFPAVDLLDPSCFEWMKGDPLTPDRPSVPAAVAPTARSRRGGGDPLDLPTLPELPSGGAHSAFHHLKDPPLNPTLTHLQQRQDLLLWPEGICAQRTLQQALSHVPHAKLLHFAAWSDEKPLQRDCQPEQECGRRHLAGETGSKDGAWCGGTSTR
jgi:hypothetical protein